ncbi:hypothetical protein P3S67_001651 [Capsicum chacoense]
MESNPSCTDVKHINEELPIKVDEKLKLIDKEEEYSDISLCQLNFNHVDDFMEWHADNKVSSFCHCYAFTSKQDAMTYIAKVIIPDPCSFDGWERCRGEIGYILGSKYWGKGIATKSTKLVRLESLVDVENTASQRGRV